MKKESKGITLIALVITIIVLIILAGVSISLVLGENGIITKTKFSKQVSLNAQVEEQEQLNEQVEYIEEMIGTSTPVEKSEIETYRDNGTFMTEKTTLRDSDGNSIEVPKGFKIAEDSGKNVTEGIVIEDGNKSVDGKGKERGNQYVWIPVGTGIKKADGTTENITLGRYTFESDGTKILKQNATNYLEQVEIDYYKELTISRNGTESLEKDGQKGTGQNATALNLKGFIDSVNSNGGYYIARYEATYGKNGKANSKVSNSYSNPPSSQAVEGTLWYDITQVDAAVASKGIYTTATTDLINSYAWDTAIVYIQKFSGDTDYAYLASYPYGARRNNTGLTEDIKCNIYDMATNYSEWTTEYSARTLSGGYVYPATTRMGCVRLSFRTGETGYEAWQSLLYYIGFRTILYM